MKPNYGPTLPFLFATDDHTNGEGVKTGRTIVDAPPIFMRVAAAASGTLSAASLLIASYVYFKFPHPTAIQHVAIPGAARSATRLESIESYLYAFPCIQMLIFVVLAFSAVRWHQVVRCLAAREARTLTKYPTLVSVDSIHAYKVVMAILIILETLMLLATSYRSLMLATNNI